MRSRRWMTCRRDLQCRRAGKSPGSDVEHQLLYVMGDVESDTRTHHIHIVKWNGIEWKNYIHFRDYLNANENVALCYQKLKEELESKYADDRVAYTNGKQDMIDTILNDQ